MAYTKQTWQDLPSKTTPINASRLGHIEQGIYDAASTADTAASDASSAISGLADKVDKVEGKGLSTNDFTDALKTKLDGIATGAEVNVQADYAQNDTTADDYIKNKPSLGTASAKDSTSVVTDSTDLVESGAVYDALGWGNKNIGQWINKNLGGDATAGYKLDNGGSSLIAKVKQNTSYTVSRKLGQGNRFRIVGFVNEPSSVASLSSEQLYSNNSADTYTVNSGSYNYLVFTYDSATSISQDTAEAMIEVGTIKTAYEPYHESVEQTLRDAEVVQGKNLLNSRNTTLYNAQIVDYTDNEMSNIQADSKTALSFIVDLFNGSSYVEHLVSQTVISNTGVHEFSFTAKSTGTVIKFGHNGSSKDVKITYAYQGGFSAGNDYIISFNLKSNHPDNVGGLVIDNIMIRKADITDSTYEPYYIPLKDVVPNKCDNSVIAPVESGATSSKAYAVGEHFIRDGAFCTCKQAIPQSGSFTLNTNYTSGDVASEIRHKIETSASNLSFNVDVGRNYIAFTRGGMNNEYSFVWLVCVNNSAAIFFIPLFTGTASTVSISSSDNTVTVTCSNTTIQMGYALL